MCQEGSKNIKRKENSELQLDWPRRSGKCHQHLKENHHEQLFQLRLHLLSLLHPEINQNFKLKHLPKQRHITANCQKCIKYLF